MNLKTAETSILIFGIYMILIPGLGLITIPEILLGLFQLDYGTALWSVRMLGLLVLLLGVYTCLISKHKISILYPSTSILRYVAAFFMLSLWAMNQVGNGILLFAAIDALGATWTTLTLKKASL